MPENDGIYICKNNFIEVVLFKNFERDCQQSQ